jgi:hypothetical protein
MSQPFLSAEIVNGVVVAVDKFLSAEDRALSSAEMSIGTALSSRNLECSFGACWVEPSDAGNALKPVVVGTGLFRKYGDAIPTAKYDSSPYEVAFDYDVFLGARPLSDVYVFGATYAVAYKVSTTPFLNINALPFKGGATNEGSPLLIGRTISVPEALELVNSEYMSAFTIIDPGDEVEYLELQRFVISVDNYTPGSNSLTEAKVYFSDKRSPRAWGGFADEISAAYFNPSSISNWRSQAEIADQITLSLYNFVSAWVDLTAWSPDFVDYWTTYNDDMPQRLKQYLLDELNIILP